MNAMFELEKQILAMPAIERERLATCVWKSSANDTSVAGSRVIDPDGIKLASTTAKLKREQSRQLTTLSFCGEQVADDGKVPPVSNPW